MLDYAQLLEQSPDAKRKMDGWKLNYQEKVK
jgi:hypothetical protein